MRCPVCDDVDLAISSREGVEIDYCPQCRGVWLDRGELDKIIDRASPILAGGGRGPAVRDAARDDRPRRVVDDRDDDRWDDDRRERGYDPRDRGHDARERGYDPRRKRRRSFLDDLFDFD